MKIFFSACCIVCIGVVSAADGAGPRQVPVAQVRVGDDLFMRVDRQGHVGGHDVQKNARVLLEVDTAAKIAPHGETVLPGKILSLRRHERLSTPIPCEVLLRHTGQVRVWVPGSKDRAGKAIQPVAGVVLLRGKDLSGTGQ